MEQFKLDQHSILAIVSRTAHGSADNPFLILVATEHLSPVNHIAFINQIKDGYVQYVTVGDDDMRAVYVVSNLNFDDKVMCEQQNNMIQQAVAKREVKIPDFQTLDTALAMMTAVALEHHNGYANNVKWDPQLFDHIAIPKRNDSMLPTITTVTADQFEFVDPELFAPFKDSGSTATYRTTGGEFKRIFIVDTYPLLTFARGYIQLLINIHIAMDPTDPDQTHNTAAELNTVLKELNTK